MTVREDTPFSKPKKVRKGNNARKGRGWEAQLKVWHDQYRARGEAWVVHTSPGIKRTGGVGRTFEATFSSKGPPDFVGVVSGPSFIHGRAVVFDAKDCQEHRWSLGNLEDHQADDLNAAHRAGAFTFVALRGPFGAWVLPWSSASGRVNLATWWAAWRGGFAPKGGASITAEDLPGLGVRMDTHGWLSAVWGLLP